MSEGEKEGFSNERSKVKDEVMMGTGGYQINAQNNKDRDPRENDHHNEAKTEICV